MNNGKLTGVTVVAYPPQLGQEALVAQSAGIDVVSGAACTSQGDQQPLQSALDSARS